MKRAFYLWITDAATRAAAEMTPLEAALYLPAAFSHLRQIGADECMGLDLGDRPHLQRAARSAWVLAVTHRADQSE